MKRKLIITLLLSFALTGCAVSGNNENTGLGFTAMEEMDYAKALEYFDAAEENKEDPQEYLRGRGIAYMGLAEYDKAVDALRSSLQNSNGRIGDIETDTSFYLAVAEFRSGDAKASKDTCTAMINLNRDNPDQYFLRGKAELRLEEDDEAIRDFNTAVSLRKDDPDLYIDIYECMIGAGLSEEAGSFLKRAMELTKINDFQKGKLQYFMGEYDSAKENLESARGDGSDPEVVLWLGKTYEALGDKSYAASLYKTYLEDDPNNVEIYNQLGVCQMDTGDYAAALNAFETGLSLGDSGITQSLLFNQIAAYEYLANFKKAAVLMEAYLQKYPDDEAAQREYKFLKTR